MYTPTNDELNCRVCKLEAQGNQYTVATLPTNAVLGDTAFVTDATSPTYNGALTGGGAVKTPVFFNGTAWGVSLIMATPIAKRKFSY